jgi:hypothetical protein
MIIRDQFIRKVDCGEKGREIFTQAFHRINSTCHSKCINTDDGS